MLPRTAEAYTSIIKLPAGGRPYRTDGGPGPQTNTRQVTGMSDPVRPRLLPMAEIDMIRTPDQRVRVFVSSTLQELAAERQAVRDAVTRLRLVPVMFELGARPHPPRQVYRSYLAQSQVFVGVYWQSYGWVAPGEQV